MVLPWLAVFRFSAIRVSPRLRRAALLPFLGFIVSQQVIRFRHIRAFPQCSNTYSFYAYTFTLATESIAHTSRYPVVWPCCSHVPFGWPSRLNITRNACIRVVRSSIVGCLDPVHSGFVVLKRPGIPIFMWVYRQEVPPLEGHNIDYLLWTLGIRDICLDVAEQVRDSVHGSRTNNSRTYGGDSLWTNWICQRTMSGPSTSAFVYNSSFFSESCGHTVHYFNRDSFQFASDNPSPVAPSRSFGSVSLSKLIPSS